MGPPLEDLVAQCAHRLDHALLGDRRFLDVAATLIERASVVQRILRHLGLPTELSEPRPAPPRQPETFEDQSRDAPEFDAAS